MKRNKRLEEDIDVCIFSFTMRLFVNMMQRQKAFEKLLSRLLEKLKCQHIENLNKNEILVTNWENDLQHIKEKRLVFFIYKDHLQINKKFSEGKQARI